MNYNDYSFYKKDFIQNNNNKQIISSIVNSIKSAEIMPEIKRSFCDFTKELEKEIFPHYERHESSFDDSRIHGRLHVARAVIFCEVMARYFGSKGKLFDFNFVRRTIGLHDSGRRGNGIDRWEKESADLLCSHLESKGIPQNEAFEKSRIIIKDGNQTSIEYQIFQSGDCLDIMRPCTGLGGRRGFQEQYLTFLKDSTPGSDASIFRQALIEEAWTFIEITEKNENKFHYFNESSGLMKCLLEVIEENSPDFPILSLLL